MTPPNDTGDDATGDAAIELPQVDWFSRSTLLSDVAAAARLGGVLAAVADGAPEAVRAGLRFLRSWQSSAALAHTPWFAGLLRDTAGSRRVLRRRLRVLGTPRTSIGQAIARPVGTPVRVGGAALRRASSSRSTHIWANSETRSGNLRRLSEEGHDFFLRDQTGCVVRVVAAGGVLVGGDRLDHGEAVEVLGFVDWVVDLAWPPEWPCSSGPLAPPGRGERLVPALRSSEELALIVLKA